MLKTFWLDEGGAILSAELCLILVLLVIGMVVGLTALRDAINFQLADIAGAIAAFDPSYSWDGLLYSSIGNGAINGFNNGVVTARVNGSRFQSTFDTGKTAGANMITVLPVTPVVPK